MRFSLLYSYLHFMFSSQIVWKYDTGLLFWRSWVWSNETCTQIFGLNQILHLCQRLNFGNVKSTRASHGWNLCSAVTAFCQSLLVPPS